jgi:hypothetical protein
MISLFSALQPISFRAFGIALNSGPKSLRAGLQPKSLELDGIAAVHDPDLPRKHLEAYQIVGKWVMCVVRNDGLSGEHLTINHVDAQRKSHFDYAAILAVLDRFEINYRGTTQVTSDTTTLVEETERKAKKQNKIIIDGYHPRLDAFQIPLATMSDAKRS